MLLGHCYRMLGHPQDADDAVQNTLIRAMRGLGSFENRSSLRTWLLRIATNVCLDELDRRKRRERPMARPPGLPGDDVTFRPAEEWIAPVPDAWVVPAEASPEEALATRQSVRLAFLTALQALPPRQRAALLLADVLGWTAAEIAAALDCSIASVNSALQRARARLASEAIPEDDAVDEVLLQRYVRAFESFDVDALVALLTQDVEFSMPPIPLWLRGPAHVAEFLRGRGNGCEGSVLVPTRASGLPAFGQYRRGGAEPWGLVVLETRGDRIAGINTFLDVDALFPLFGLPLGTGDDQSPKKIDALR